MCKDPEIRCSKNSKELHGQSRIQKGRVKRESETGLGLGQKELQAQLREERTEKETKIGPGQ